MKKERLIGKTLKELQELSLSLGLPKFAGAQMARWLSLSRFPCLLQLTLRANTSFQWTTDGKNRQSKP